jgi:hypothetical protein
MLDSTQPPSFGGFRRELYPVRGHLHGHFGVLAILDLVAVNCLQGRSDPSFLAVCRDRHFVADCSGGPHLAERKAEAINHARRPVIVFANIRFCARSTSSARGGSTVVPLAEENRATRDAAVSAESGGVREGFDVV